MTGNVLRRPHRDHLSTPTAAFRPQVDNPISRLDHVQIVLDDDDGIAAIPQLVQHCQKLFDVVEMQASGRFVQNIQRLAGVALGVAYFGWMHSSSSMATLGKMAIGIKVVREDGSRISFMRGMGRYFALIVSSIPLGLGFVMAGFTERKRALHDMMCDTVVVDKWAFTAQPELQRRELGTVTIIVLVLFGLLLAVGLLAIVAAVVFAGRALH